MVIASIGTRSSIAAVRPPSYLIEYGYYAVVFYAMLGQALGISFPLVGSGMLGGLAMLCAMHFGLRARPLYEPIALGLGCAISTILVQLFFHQESIMNSELRNYMTWALSLVVVQALYLRQGFLHRFALFAFLIGCATLPYLETYGSTGEITRMGVSHDVGLANPNSFGMWFGFCCVYFLVLGLETNNYIIRAASWSAGLVCFYLVAMTVSRGPLLGVFISAAFAFRTFLRRSFLPILMLLFVFWIIYITGAVDDLIGYYIHRGTEESGRSYLWSVGLKRFLEAWWGGVGISNAKIKLPVTEYVTNPHNGLLYIGMASGIIPLAFFVAYLIRAGYGAIGANMQKTRYASFVFPLFIFAFLELMINGAAFMSGWHMVIFSMAISCDLVPRVQSESFNKKNAFNSELKGKKI